MLKTLGMVLGLMASPVSQNSQLIDSGIKMHNYNLIHRHDIENDSDENLVSNAELSRSATINAQSILVNNKSKVTSNNDAIMIDSIYWNSDCSDSSNTNYWALYWVSGYWLDTADDFKNKNFYGELKLNYNDDSLIAINSTSNLGNKYNYGLYFRIYGASAVPNNLYDIWYGYMEFYLRYIHQNNVLSIFNVDYIKGLKNTDDGCMQANVKMSFLDENGALSYLQAHLIYDFWNPSRSIINIRSYISLNNSFPVSKKIFEKYHGKTSITWSWHNGMDIYLNNLIIQAILFALHFKELKSELEKFKDPGKEVEKIEKIEKFVTKMYSKMMEAFVGEAEVLSTEVPVIGNIVVLVVSVLIYMSLEYMFEQITKSIINWAEEYKDSGIEINITFFKHNGKHMHIRQQ